MKTPPCQQRTMRKHHEDQRTSGTKSLGGLPDATGLKRALRSVLTSMEPRWIRRGYEVAPEKLAKVPRGVACNINAPALHCATRHEDNDLLRIAAEREEFYRQTDSTLDNARALIAFAGLCVLLYLALYLGPVLP